MACLSNKAKGNNTKLLKIAIQFLAFFIMPTLIAQQPWTLDDCVAYALEHNLEIRDFAYSQESGKETYRQSIRSLLPSVSGYSEYSIRYGRSTDPNTNDIVNNEFFSNDYSLNSTVDIFRGFQKLNTIKASKFIYQATKEELEQQKYLLAFRVMTAFFDIQFFEGLLANAREQVEISQYNFELVEKQIELGMKAGADLYEAESALLTDQLAVTQAANQLATARLTLRQAMNLKSEVALTLKADLPDELNAEAWPELQADSLYRTALEVVPAIRAREFRALAAKKEVGIARGGLMPTIALQAGYGTGYYETNVDENGTLIPFRNQIKDNASRFVGVSMNIPISNGWSARSRIRQQKIARKQAENALELQKQQLYQLIEQLVQENNSLRREYEQSLQAVRSQNLAFTIAQKRYDKGLINALDLFQAKNLYAAAQNENLQVGLRLRVNEKTLDFYEGEPVFQINAFN